MNQTDLQGETERALRAATCPDCARDVPMSQDDRLRGDWHTRNEERWPCQSKHAELLPLFNAGVEQAEIKAHTDGEKHIWGLIQEVLNMKANDFDVESRLAAIVGEAVAGAYAAAAKHCMVPSVFGSPKCACGKFFNHFFPAAIKEWCDHILALTPADARQASQPHQAVTVQGVYKARKASAVNLIKGVDGPVPAGVTFVYLDAEGRRCMQFVCDCLPAHGRNADEDAARIADALNDQSAAIASAESRARQFQELADIVRTSHERSIYHANGGRCRVCELLSEIPDTRGLAAARTPDSTGCEHRKREANSAGEWCITCEHVFWGKSPDSTKEPG